MTGLLTTDAGTLDDCGFDTDMADPLLVVWVLVFAKIKSHEYPHVLLHAPYVVKRKILT